MIFSTYKLGMANLVPRCVDWIPSPCPLPAPSHACFGINPLGEGGSFAGGGGRPHLQAFSPHQRRSVRLNLKPAAGEGNQRGGYCSAVQVAVYE